MKTDTIPGKLKELLNSDNLSEGTRNFVKGLQKYYKKYRTLSEKQSKVLDEIYSAVIRLTY